MQFTGKMMKCFTWESPADRPNAGIGVERIVRDPAFYAEYLAPYVFIMGARFWHISPSRGGPAGLCLYHCEVLHRNYNAAPYSVCLLELPPEAAADPTIHTALVATPFATQLITPDNAANVVYQSAAGSMLFTLEIEVPVAFGDYTLVFNGETVEVYDTESYQIWWRVIDSFDFSIPPESED